MRYRICCGFLFVVTIFCLAGCSRGPSDESIATQIKAKFFSDPLVKSASLGVSVTKGEVTLSGTAGNPEVELQAFKLAASIEGVRRVRDQIEVIPPDERPQVAAALANVIPAAAPTGLRPQEPAPRQQPEYVPNAPPPPENVRVIVHRVVERSSPPQPPPPVPPNGTVAHEVIVVVANPAPEGPQPSESVREHQAGLQSFRSMRRIDARRKNANALRLRFSQSLASLRQRLSQAMVRSTTQRRGNTTNPLA